MEKVTPAAEDTAVTDCLWWEQRDVPSIAWIHSPQWERIL